MTKVAIITADNDIEMIGFSNKRRKVNFENRVMKRKFGLKVKFKPSDRSKRLIMFKAS